MQMTEMRSIALDNASGSSRELSITMPAETSHLVTSDHPRRFVPVIKTETSDTVKCVFTSILFVTLVIGALYVTFFVNPQM